MNDQESQTLTIRLLEQIDRQSEIIAYLLGKNERLRSQLRDIEQSRQAKLDHRTCARWPGTSMP